VANSFPFGTTVLVRTTTPFRDRDLEPTHPTTVTILIKPPGQVATTHEYGVDLAVVRESAGVYELDVTCNLPGKWEARIIGDGVIKAVDEIHWTIERSVFA